jgi:phage replication O-like protein O
VAGIGLVVQRHTSFLPEDLPRLLYIFIMANPQKENGHLDLANEIVEALARIRLSGEESQCLWAIFRKTYSWHKKEDQISLSQFAIITGLNRPAVVRALKKLLSKKIIAIIKNDNTGINTYRFNKDFDTWKPLSKKITVLSKKIMGVINIDNQVLSKKIHTKENITKETITKEIIYSKFQKPEIEVLIMYFQEKGIMGEQGKREGEKFFDFYESKGWFVGKNKMKDWKAAVRNWIRGINRESIKPKTKISPGHVSTDFSKERAITEKHIAEYEAKKKAEEGKNV